MLAVITVKERLLLFFIKCIGLAIKMVFILSIAKLLSIKDVAAYGEFMSYLNFLLVVFGFEIYTYSQRKISSSTFKMQQISNHVLSQFILFFPLLVILIVFHSYGLVNTYSFSMLLILLVFELISQELSRFLIALDMHLQSAIASFIRNSSWSLLSITLFVFIESEREVGNIFYIYLAMSVLSLLYSGYKVSKFFTEHDEAVNFDIRKFSNWFVGSMKNSSLYFISGVSASFLFFIDRYMLSHFSSDKDLATHTVFIAVSLSITSLLLSTVYSYNLPNIVRVVKSKSVKNIQKLFSHLTMEVVILLMLVDVLVVFILPYLFQFIGKEEYISLINYFYLLLIVANVNSISYIPHYYMYSSDMDKTLCIISITGVVVFVVTIFVLFYLNISPLFSVGFGLLTTFSYMLLSKSVIAAKHFFRLRNEKETRNICS